jgi:hypothetical protein
MTDCPESFPEVLRDRSGICRHLTCSRCKQHTDNNTQGHYWAYCKITKTMRDFHFCCPDDCELQT